MVVVCVYGHVTHGGPANTNGLTLAAPDLKPPALPHTVLQESGNKSTNGF